jgi:phosphoribosylformylglycinamidine (FGAM) synthase PurS component
MKAKISISLKGLSVEEAQKLLSTLCEGLIASSSIEDYSFEIETDSGTVTEKCLLSEGRVIA